MTSRKVLKVSALVECERLLILSNNGWQEMGDPPASSVNLKNIHKQMTELQEEVKN